MLEYHVVRNDKLIPCQGLQPQTLAIETFRSRIYSIEDYQVDPSLEPFGRSLPKAIFDLGPQDGFCFVLSNDGDAALGDPPNRLGSTHKVDLWCPGSPRGSVFAGADTPLAIFMAPILYRCHRSSKLKSVHMKASAGSHLMREIFVYRNPLKRGVRFHLYVNLPVDVVPSQPAPQVIVSIGFLKLDF
jgi:hypothetical protein